MILSGKLISETPIYRGNARKTLFTRDEDGKQRLVSLAGEIAGTAQSLMDAFIGRSNNGKNIGLLNQMWQRLFNTHLPDGLISKVDCSLRKDYYPKNNFFDLRMGIKLDDDRWAVESHKNYKYETLFRNSVFDFAMYINDSQYRKFDNDVKLYHLLKELEAGRFWFGAGKSKGLGRCRLKLDNALTPPSNPLSVTSGANHMTIDISFTASNPFLVSWPWGKLDPDIPSFVPIEGKFLIEGLRNLPEPVRNRLSTGMGGAILKLKEWKEKFSQNFPKAVLFSLQDQSETKVKKYVLPASSVKKMSKGRYALPGKILKLVDPIIDKGFGSEQELMTELEALLKKESGKSKRFKKAFEVVESTEKGLNRQSLTMISKGFGWNMETEKKIMDAVDDENLLLEIISSECQRILPVLYQDIDRQTKMLQSDPWVDLEITSRREHLQIKEMLRDGKITESQWDNMNTAPSQIKESVWRQFKNEHARVRYKFMCNRRNLQKSIQNDKNYIDFLMHYRNRVRQELSLLKNYDYRPSGDTNSEVSKKYGKPYDNMFMRMLQWNPSDSHEGEWEICIPGSTLKGAFRKRASMILSTIMEQKRDVQWAIDKLFGAQGKRGLIFFSDAYLVDNRNVDQKFCSMDGVRMDPGTGRPVDEAKSDYLYAYGDELKFSFRLDIQDLTENDLEILDIMKHLVSDFTQGDIPIGSLKTSGFGWVKADINQIEWLSMNTQGMHQRLFGDYKYDVHENIWHRVILEGDDAQDWFGILMKRSFRGAGSKNHPRPVPRAREGFISHNAFGGYCGHLFVEGKTITPLFIQESGEPSFKAYLGDAPVNGWDFFSYASPDSENRNHPKQYVIPSKSLKGMIRHIYAATSNSVSPSTDISRLNPVDSLFGWVGNRPNAALMGRLSIGFATFDDPRQVWYKIPYPYGEWQFENGKWVTKTDTSAKKIRIADEWRIFPHAPLAPCVETLSAFEPDTTQAKYVHAVMKDVSCRFAIRFWNLEKEELERLIWCIHMEDDMAHKIGNSRYLGFGSLALSVQPESYLIDWDARYQGGKETDWQIPLTVSDWLDPKGVSNLEALRKQLHVH